VPCQIWSNGMELADIQFPEQACHWRLFRYNSISRVVNGLSNIAHQRIKLITAAVFPTKFRAAALSRELDKLEAEDGVCPMIYHGFYKEK